LLVLQGQMSAGGILAGAILMGRALAPIEQVIAAWPTIQDARSAWHGLQAILAEDYDENPSMKMQSFAPSSSLTLELRDLSLCTSDQREPILKDLNLQIKPGEVVGVIGKSGAGKSSFARLAIGASRPSKGDVLIAEAHISQYDPDFLGRQIGYLPQQVGLFPATIAENIARMTSAPKLEEVISAAQSAGCHEFITDLPDGYSTDLGAGRWSLSGGQVQRIGLARALFGNPSILVLDEPNSALDADGTRALNACISGFKAAGKMVLIMTHRPTAIAHASRLIILEQGRVVADGPPDKIIQKHLKNANHIRTVFSMDGAA